MGHVTPVPQGVVQVLHQTPVCVGGGEVRVRTDTSVFLVRVFLVFGPARQKYVAKTVRVCAMYACTTHLTLSALQLTKSFCRSEFDSISASNCNVQIV